MFKKLQEQGFTLTEVIIIGGVAMILALSVINFYQGRIQYNKFMDQCMRDHKEYECRIMLQKVVLQ